MFSLFAPDKISALIVAILRNENSPVFGQVATVDEGGNPQIRTVHLRYLENENTLGFNTHIQSPKWTQLERSKRISGVYFDHVSLCQFRWTGFVELVGSGHLNNPDLTNEMWSITPHDVQKAYWSSFQPQTTSIPFHLPCPTFGTVVCRPSLWDIYKMGYSNYADHERSIFRLLDGQWIEEGASTLYSQAR